MLKKSLVSLLLFISMTSCYRMPCDDDCSLVPLTNNPSVTRERGQTGMTPSIGM